MRFIKKNGRVIPIREKGEYRSGYGASGALAAGASLAAQATAMTVHKGLKLGTWAGFREGLRHPGVLGGKGKLALGLYGSAIGLAGLSKLNAAYHIMKSPEGKRMEEAAKHGAAIAIGYKAGAMLGIPMQAMAVKHGLENLASVYHGKKVEVNVAAITKHYMRLGSNNIKRLGGGK
jgi:hypothetical protein